MKMLCTGNPKTSKVASYIKKEFPMCDFISSTNGWDLINDCKQEFIDKIKNYNIFINNAHLSGHQVKLLDWTNEAWDQGFVFNIGSFSEIFDGDTGDIENNYINDKVKLKKASMSMCNENFKTTHIILDGQCSDNLGPFIRYAVGQDIEIPLVVLQNSGKGKPND